MSTYTVHPHDHRRRGAPDWTLDHPLVSTIGALVAAVVTGVLIGIFFPLLFSGAETATPHRAGGHALATVTAAQHAAAGRAGAASADVTPVRVDLPRSPARGGFAVGRTPGATDGLIVVPAGIRAPARGGFSGRSLVAEKAPGFVQRAT